MSVKSILESTFSYLYEEPITSTPEPDPTEELAETKEQNAELDGEPQPSEPAADEEPEPNSEVVEKQSPPEPDMYQQAVQVIQERLNQSRNETNAVKDHLLQARERALELEKKDVVTRDELYGPEHHKTGLPLGESHLSLDSDLLKQHKLLHAHELLVNVQKARAQAMCEKVLETSIIAQEVSARPDPHYMQETHCYKMHSAGHSVKAIRTLKTTKREFTERLPEKMTMEQLKLEQQIMKKLQTPLNFLKNPRHTAANSGYAVLAPNPKVVNFTNYESGGVYEIPLKLENVSAVSQRFRLLPPSSPFFTIGSVAYPKGSGDLAPGMHAICRIRFNPDSLGDYTDTLKVCTNSFELEVEIKARRAPPILNIPDLLDCQSCFISSEVDQVFEGRNSGGPGRFQIVLKSSWDDGGQVIPDFNSLDESADTVSTEVFSISPARLNLDTGDHFALNVTFSPKQLGPQELDLVIICDNCQTRSIKVSGVGTMVNVALSIQSQAGMHLGLNNGTQELLFGSCCVDAKGTCILSCTNETPLPVPFKWELFSLPLEMLSLSTLRTLDQTPRPIALDSLRLISDQNEDVCFTLTPNEGVLPPNSSMDFTASFHPMEPTLYTLFAKLSMPGVPVGALEIADDSENQTMMGLRLEGRGVTEDAFLSPAALVFPGTALIGDKTTQAVTITNPNNAVRAFLIQSPDNLLDADVKFSPNQGTLRARESITITVTITPRRTGRIEMEAKCRVEHCSTLGLPIQMDVDGPSFVILQPCVDYGLVPTDKTAVQTLRFTNSSARPSNWLITTVGSDEGFDAPISNELQVGHVKLLFTARSGNLRNFTAKEISITLQCTGPMLLDTALELRVQDGASQFVRITASAISRMITVMPSLLQLETAYVEVPVYKTLQVRNATRIPTGYTWNAVKSPDWTITTSPERGTLEAGEEHEVTVTITPHREMPNLEDILVCNIECNPVPVGVKVAADVRGLLVSFDVLQERPANPVRVVEPHVPPNQSMLPAVVLDFGKDVPINETKMIHLKISNHSAVLTRFSLFMKKYKSSNDAYTMSPLTPGSTLVHQTNTPRAMSQSSRGGGSVSLGAGARPKLGRIHETSQPFNSDAGRQHTAAMLHNQHTAALLDGGPGCVFEVLPDSADLGAWEEFTVDIVCHNNMWGSYKDALVVEIDGLEPIELPVEIFVTGSPLSLNPTTLGLSMKHSPPLLSWQPTASSGSNAAPAVKQIKVLNSSPEPIAVEWSMCSTKSPDKALDATLAVQTGGSVSLSLGSSLPKPLANTSACPFKVSPMQVQIPACSSVVFAVEFEDQTSSKFDGCIMLQGVHPKPIQLLDGTSTTKHPPLIVNLLGETFTPALEIHERTKTHWKVSSIDPLSDKSFFKKVTLANRCPSSVSFKLETDSPLFQVINIQSSFSKAAHSLQQSAPLGPEKSAVMLTVPPRESIKATVQFSPSRSKNSPESTDASSTASDGRRSVSLPSDETIGILPVNYNGLLVATFSNGTTQQFTLKGEVHHPALETQTPEIKFGQIHVDQSKNMILELYNPTEVPAKWSVKHYVARLTSADILRKRSVQLKDMSMRGEELDSPEVFTFGETSGVVPPKMGRVPITALPSPGAASADSNLRGHRIPIIFKPKGKERYKSRFEFRVENGTSCSITLSGVGSYDEEDDVLPTQKELNVLA